ncbi:hypothetical protein CU098_005579 [Rhizopus stolonifer]|uniref:Uncharacterized protein n=1 Tax=Rhizopus stolonifer TaxID=4846 RepID=A0A367JLV1_RHIST|nr:hypothetical protein CU098_005579 [Rhizopus stolonifer]
MAGNSSILEENSDISNTNTILEQQPSDESFNDYVTVPDNTDEKPRKYQALSMMRLVSLSLRIIFALEQQPIKNKLQTFFTFQLPTTLKKINLRNFMKKS